MTWKIIPCSDYEKDKKDFAKKWPDEMQAIAANLCTFFRAIDAGAKQEQLKTLGFVHSEPLGILALDERGCKKRTKRKALRLYIFVDDRAETIFVMLIGDKSSQSRDIALCRGFVQPILDARKKSEAESRQSHTESESS